MLSLGEAFDTDEKCSAKSGTVAVGAVPRQADRGHATEVTDVAVEFRSELFLEATNFLRFWSTHAGVWISSENEE